MSTEIARISKFNRFPFRLTLVMHLPPTQVATRNMNRITWRVACTWLNLKQNFLNNAARESHSNVKKKNSKPSRKTVDVDKIVRRQRHCNFVNSVHKRLLSQLKKKSWQQNKAAIQVTHLRGPRILIVTIVLLRPIFFSGQTPTLCDPEKLHIFKT